MTYAFFPQMDPLYQFLHVLKYFFLVPATCWRAHTLGLKEKGGGGQRRWEWQRCEEGQVREDVVEHDGGGGKLMQKDKKIRMRW